MQTQVNKLIDWLNKNRPKLSPYRAMDSKRYVRIEHRSQHSDSLGEEFWTIHCFIPKEDFTTKMTGPMKYGKLYMPAGPYLPARHPRGDLFAGEEAWNGYFTDYGLRYLR